jgi:hypothetical protein
MTQEMAHSKQANPQFGNNLSFVVKSQVIELKMLLLS